jgi:DNA polymerase
MPILHRDYETRSVADLKRVGAHVYAAHATTDVWCCAFAVDDGDVQFWTPGMPVPPEFIEAANNPDWIVVAHNDRFERLVEQHIMAPRYGWLLVPLERHRCTMASALAHALPAELESVTKALGLEHQKDNAGARLMKEMARPRKPRAGENPNGIYWVDDATKLERLFEYCRQDIRTERALHERIGFISAAEQRVWELDAVINDRGVCLDIELLNGALRIAEEHQAASNPELAELTGGAVTSISQVARLIEWLGERGVKVDDVRKPTLHKELSNGATPEVRRVIELRLAGAHAAANKLATLKEWCGAENRVRGGLIYHGGATGRWSSWGVQLHNLKKPTTVDVKAAIPLVSSGDLQSVKRHFADPMGIVGDISRAILCAAPGHRLLIADFSGIESRLTAFVSGQQSKVRAWALYDQTKDKKLEPYYLLGKKFGQPEETARNIGKTADLAFGYSGGVGAWRRLASDSKLSDAEIDILKNRWRDEHPQTVRFWNALSTAAARAIRMPNNAIGCGRVSFHYDGAFLRMQLPSGRSIAYPHPRVEANEFGKLGVFFKDNSKGFTDVRAWRGLLIENVVQGVARDLFAEALLRLEAAGYPVVLHVHDEIVVEAPNGFGSVEEFHKLMTGAPAWADGLPVEAEPRNGQRFIKMKKPKMASGRESIEALDAGEPVNVNATPEPEIQQNSQTPPWESDKENTMPPFIITPDEAPRPIKDAAPIVPDTLADIDAKLALFQRPEKANGYPHGEKEPRSYKATTDFVYRDKDGNPYLKVRKFVGKNGKKAFPQYHLENGHWVKGKPAGQRIPYRLPELLAAPADSIVDIFEGEKDADRGAELGLIATSNPEGAGKWGAELNEYFRGRRVRIHEDNDKAGRGHVAKIAAALKGIAREILIVRYPELPEQGDFFDFIALGGTVKLMAARAKAVNTHRQLIYIDAADVEIEAVEWWWKNRFARGKIALIAGMPDMGKGQILAFIVAAITAQLRLPCKEGVAPQGRVIWLNAEDGTADTVKPRLIAAGADINRVRFIKAFKEGDATRTFSLVTDLDLLRQMIEEMGDVVLIVIDPITAYLGVGKVDNRQGSDVRGVLTPFKELLEELRVGAVGITHFNKKDDVKSALLRILDSVSYVAAARHVYAVLKDPEDKDSRLFLKAKNNLGDDADTKGLRYGFSTKEVGYDDRLKTEIIAPFVVWHSEHVDLTADEALAAAGDHYEAGETAKDFLLKRLASGPVLATEILEEAKANDIAVRTLKRAKKKLGIDSVRQDPGDNKSPWVWALPSPGGI